MSLRLGLIALCLAAACGGGEMRVKKGEPQTAREKMLAEQKAHPEEDDAGPKSSKKWSGWRYQGERQDCFFLVGKRCFKTKKAACAAAKCKAPSKCSLEGAGPQTVKCEKK
jgi:hypothetical protein